MSENKKFAGGLKREKEIIMDINNIGKATVEYRKKIDSFEEAVKVAKGLSFSLADSFLPDIRENFEKFTLMEFEAYCLEWNANRFLEKWSYTFPENLTNGDPVCEVSGGAYQYITTGGTQFTWSETTKMCVVRMDTESLSESSGYVKALSSGWRPHILCSEPVEIPVKTPYSTGDGGPDVYDVE